MDFNPIFGTNGDDSLQGTSANDSIEGGLGNDTLFSGDFNDDSDDILFGGEGDDVLIGVGGRDTLVGGSGFDGYSGDLVFSGGTIVVDEVEGEISDEDGGVNIFAENSNGEFFNTISANIYNFTEEEIIATYEDPNTWGDAFIELSRPQAGIIGIEKSGTDLIVDISRDGVANVEDDWTIVNYFDEQGNLGAGAPLNINNLIFREQDIVDLFANDSSSTSNNNFGTTVYRFFNNNTGVHFYTANETERNAVEDLDNFNPEGASYQGADPLTGGSTPVYRFLNEDTGVHLYTVSEAERETTQNLANFSFEGEAFSAYSTPVDGSIPIYRFFNSTTGAHFYTPNAAERDNVEDNLPEFQSEGIAYYALPIESEAI